MGKRKYTREFRESAVGLVLREGRTVEQAAADLGMPANTLTAWVGQARHTTGVFTPAAQADLAVKVRELEAENRRLKIGRDILIKATAFFARDEGGRP
jgi:transposase